MCETNDFQQETTLTPETINRIIAAQNEIPLPDDYLGGIEARANAAMDIINNAVENKPLHEMTQEEQDNYVYGTEPESETIS